MSNDNLNLDGIKTQFDQYLQSQDMKSLDKLLGNNEPIKDEKTDQLNDESNSPQKEKSSQRVQKERNQGSDRHHRQQ